MALYPVYGISPLKGNEYGDVERTIVYYTYDELPPFTLLLPWKCPECDEGQSYDTTFRSADDEHQYSHRRAITQPLFELRYCHEVRHVIGSELMPDQEEQDLILSNLEALASKCEFAAQWQPGYERNAYLKIVPGPVNWKDGLENYQIPLFSIRPSETVYDRIDTSIIFYNLKMLPASAILMPPPRDEQLFDCYELDDEVHSREEDRPTTRVSPTTPKEALDGQDPWEQVLLAPDPELDSWDQLLIAGMPDPSIYTLVVHAFRSLRHMKVRHVFSSLLRSYLEAGSVWEAPMLRDQRFFNYRGICLVDWWDPEEGMDYLHHRFRGHRTPFVHLKPLNKKELIKVSFNHYAFIHYRPLDLSLTSTEIRLIEGDISPDLELPEEWKFIHTNLDSDECPGFHYILDTVNSSISANPQCQIISLDGEEIAIPLDVIRGLRVAVNQEAEATGSVTKLRALIPLLCSNPMDEEEKIHYEALSDRLQEKATGFAILRDMQCDIVLAEANVNARHIYKPLTSGECQIRLLRFTATGGPDITAPLKGELLITNLDAAPEFIALSYVWGSPNKTGEVTIDGARMETTQDLNNALRHLRLAAKDGYVWVDFLCIDQQNLDERAEQLGLMTDIYAKSEYVYAWLGAIDYRCSPCVEALSQAFVAYSTGDESAEFLERIHHAVEVDYALDPLRALLQAPWWERLWIVQESVLANPLKLCTSTETIGWETLNNALQALSLYFHICTARSDLAPRAAVRSIRHLLPNAVEVSNLRQNYQATSTEKDFLLWCLSILHHRQYTEPRDVIYAANMLAKDKPLIIPSYRKSIMQVYRDAAIAIIEHRNDLRLLSFPLFSRRRYEPTNPDWDACTASDTYWPSWVPDWRLRPWGLGVTTFDLGDTVHSPHLKFDASGSTKAHVNFSSDLKIMHCSGIVVGTINKVYGITDSMEYVKAHDQAPDEWWQINRLTRPGDTEDYVAEGTWATAWIETCKVLDKEWFQGDANRDLFQPTLIRGETMVRGETYENGPDYSDIDLQNTWTYGSEPPSNWEAIAAIIKPTRVLKTQGKDQWAERRWHPICLDSGHVGFGGHAVREGDISCVLRGGDYPFILRERKDGLYHLVSDSYIHGIMHGEYAMMRMGDGQEWEELGII